MQDKVQFLFNQVLRDDNPGWLASLRQVESKVVAAFSDHGDSREAQVKCLVALQAIDAITASEISEFSDDPKLAAGYPKAAKVSSEVFWSQWFPRLVTHRQSLWNRVFNDQTQGEAA